MIRNTIQRFMYGRYGGDQLNVFLLVLYLIFYFISIWAENAKFMQLAGPAINWFHLRRTMHRDKEHRYFRCPSCGQQLRVPKGKGKITVTCRSCGAVFQEKS